MIRMSASDRLPQCDQLNVEVDKVRAYLLNREHAEGGSKAKFFINRGFAPDEPAVMIEALLTHGQNQPVVETNDTKFGKKFVVQCQIETPDGRNPCIVSVWIVEGEAPPRLVTARPNR